MSRKDNEYCSNCGSQGHLFRDCTSPVMSYGIIAIRYSSEDLDKKNRTLCSPKSLITGLDDTSTLQFLLIQRKDSLNFVEFIRGKYDITDMNYIERMFRNMTIAEQERILYLDFEGLWKSVWGRTSRSHRSEFDSSVLKYNKIRNLLPGIIQKNRSSWTEPEWGFPKGRRNYLENDISCAVREFIEETGLSKNSFRIIENIMPITEKFFGSNYVHYCHKYYIGVCYPNVDVSMNYDNETMSKEIGDIKWLTHEQALAKIRPDNIEKREILLNVMKIMKNFLPFIPNMIPRNLMNSYHGLVDKNRRTKKTVSGVGIGIGIGNGTGSACGNMLSYIESDVYVEEKQNNSKDMEKCLVVL